MDTWGFIILAIGGLLFFVDKKHGVAWGFVAGIGAGIVIGAIWGYLIVMRLLP